MIHVITIFNMCNMSKKIVYLSNLPPYNAFFKNSDTLETQPELRRFHLNNWLV